MRWGWRRVCDGVEGDGDGYGDGDGMVLMVLMGMEACGAERDASDAW